MTVTFRKSSQEAMCDQCEDNSLSRGSVVFDGGNRTLQWVDPLGEIHTIPSFLKVIDPTWEDVELADRSVIIESGGETFIVGQLAREMRGIPIFQDDKMRLASRLVLAALQPNPEMDAVRVERLIVALPNARNQADVSYLKAIEGIHEFTRNGQTVVASVRRVEPIDETKAAYSYAVQQGYYLSKRNPNGVLDL